MDHPTIELIKRINYTDGICCKTCKNYNYKTKSCDLHKIKVQSFASCNYLDIDNEFQKPKEKNIFYVQNDCKKGGEVYLTHKGILAMYYAGENLTTGDAVSIDYNDGYIYRAVIT